MLSIPIISPTHSLFPRAPLCLLYVSAHVSAHLRRCTCICAHIRICDINQKSLKYIYRRQDISLKPQLARVLFASSLRGGFLAARAINVKDPKQILCQVYNARSAR